jgi:hypothetical protein
MSLTLQLGQVYIGHALLQRVAQCRYMSRPRVRKHAQSQVLVRGTNVAQQAPCHVRFGARRAQTKGLRHVRAKVIGHFILQRGLQLRFCDQWFIVLCWRVCILLYSNRFIHRQAQVGRLQGRGKRFFIRCFVAQKTSGRTRQMTGKG